MMCALIVWQSVVANSMVDVGSKPTCGQISIFFCLPVVRYIFCLPVGRYIFCLPVGRVYFLDKLDKDIRSMACGQVSQSKKASSRRNVSTIRRTEKRTAKFRCVVAFLGTNSDDQPVFFEGEWAGYIAQERTGKNGFGYDSVFVDLQSNLTAAELESDQKNKISHRGKAMQSLKSYLG